MDYNNLTLKQLKQILAEQGIKSISKYKKQELINILKDINNKNKTLEEDTTIGQGVLEVLPEGYGFLRGANFSSSSSDIYVSSSLIKKFNLKTGDYIIGNAKKNKDAEKFSALLFINSINGDPFSIAIKRTNFEKLTPIYPLEKITLEFENAPISSRIIDIICPLGRGQRGIIVAPPKTGKTTLLKSIANSITKNHQDIHLLVLLIDERPEEVTDIKRSIEGKNTDVIYSTFDEQPEHHRKISEIVLERAKRIAEAGKHAVILLDSITRLARTYNLITPYSGRTLSGGLDPATLYMPKKFFGAARNIENGGSLTIIATALIDTGNKMDDIIFEEFKGTGNMELVLNRKLAEKRVFPAIDITKSSTRKEELLLSQKFLDASFYIRKLLENNSAKALDMTQKIINCMQNTKNNNEFIKALKKLK